jgi:hypothetical protein
MTGGPRSGYLLGCRDILPAPLADGRTLLDHFSARWAAGFSLFLRGECTHQPGETDDEQRTGYHEKPHRARKTSQNIEVGEASPEQAEI